MSKVIPIALANHYAGETTTICACIKVTRKDGVILGFTSLDREVVVSGQTYKPSFDLSAIATSETLNVDNLELTVLPDEEMVTSEDLRAGRWTGAEFVVFEVNYNAPGDGINILKRGTAGETKQNRGKFTIEFRGLTQALQPPQGKVTQKTCRARLGDELCRVDLDPWTETGIEVVAVMSRQVFSDGFVSGAEDIYSEGLITFETGANAGITQKIKGFDSGTYTMSLPFPFDIQDGDFFTVVAGCRKRLTEDCRDKFDNVLNFQGVPHLPGIDRLTASSSEPLPEAPPPE